MTYTLFVLFVPSDLAVLFMNSDLDLALLFVYNTPISLSEKYKDNQISLSTFYKYLSISSYEI